MRGVLVLACLAVLTGCGGNAGPLASASATDLAFVTAEASWDLNRDGNVTCAEWKQYAASLFKDADRDRDGILSREEFSAMSRQDRCRITLPELADKPNPAFALLDKNGDCVISSNERFNLAESRRPDEKRPVANPIPRSGRPGGY
jgi:hypothetical protein